MLLCVCGSCNIQKHSGILVFLHFYYALSLRYSPLLSLPVVVFSNSNNSAMQSRLFFNGTSLGALECTWSTNWKLSIYYGCENYQLVSVLFNTNYYNFIPNRFEFFKRLFLLPFTYVLEICCCSSTINAYTMSFHTKWFIVSHLDRSIMFVVGVFNSVPLRI